MSQKVVYITGIVLVLVWGLPSIFSALVLWFLLYYNTYVDIAIDIADAKRKEWVIQKNTSTPTCAGRFQSGKKCKYKAIAGGSFCKRHLLSSET